MSISLSVLGPEAGRSQAGSDLETGLGLGSYWDWLELDWVQGGASGESKFVFRLNRQVKLIKDNPELQWPR